MMDLRTIRDLADQQARRAAREGQQPYVPFDAEEVRQYGVSTKIPFPNIGSYRPKGWLLLEDKTMLVDSSGFGSWGEPALTLPGFRAKVLEYMQENPKLGYAIIEEGQFQVYIGVFAPKESANTNTKREKGKD